MALQYNRYAILISYFVTALLASQMYIPSTFGSIVPGKNVNRMETQPHTIYVWEGKEGERGHHHGYQHHPQQDNHLAQPGNVSFIPCNQGNQPQTEANPYDCTSYFVCSGIYYRMVLCPGDLHFNRKTLQCDWKENAKCVEIPDVVEKTYY